ASCGVVSRIGTLSGKREASRILQSNLFDGNGLGHKGPVSDRAKLCEPSTSPSNIGSAVLNVGTSTELTKLPVEYFEQHWYAAYTCANHEKRVAQQLEQKCVVYYLPLYDSVRRWKDRRVCLQMPLFPGYVFVRLALQHR